MFTIRKSPRDTRSLVSRRMGPPQYSSLADTWAEIAPDDRLRWCQLTVGGRRAVCGVGGGTGPPVVFLHGWALGSHAYRRAISRLVSRGCRVFAPALPSFGGTADLPVAEMNLDGYARWVSSFVAEVGIDEPAVLIGHSFGGGVALKLAALNPGVVSYLVLLNAVGGVSRRQPWELLAGFGRELWPPTTTVDLARAVRSDLMPNLLGNPCGLVRCADIAWRADLRREAEDVRSMGIPVLVLTGHSDGVIPRGAFESLCNAIGADGRVVEGGHSWMLADPDSFSAAIGTVIDRHVARHRSSGAATRAGQLAELLHQERIPRSFVADLLANAPPLWLLSETVPVLAADLTMCFPRPTAHEVRALARPIEQSEAIRLTIVAIDRKGLLADTSAVLASSGLSITHASAATWPAEQLALQSFVVDARRKMDEPSWDELGRKLQVMAATRTLPPPRPARPIRVTVHGGGADQMLVTVTVRDEIGALAGLCRVFSDNNMSIESLHARSAGGQAHDTFLLSGVPDEASISELFARPGRGRPTRLDPARRTQTGNAPQTKRNAGRQIHLMSVQ